MIQIQNDLDIKKQARSLGVSFWQAPSFLFIVLGLLIIFVMTAVFLASRESISLQQLVVAEFFVVVVILSIGNLLIEMLEKMIAANKSKSEFISIISHQLKTPLTGISWDVELFNSKYKEGLTKKQLEILDNIESSNIAISKMVNDLLDVARIDQNNFFTQKDEIDITEVIQKVVDKNAILSKNNRVKINFLVDDNMPKIIGDKKKTEVVLDNIVSNAVKYNRDGGEVLIRARKNGQEAVITVKDTGMGINEIDQDMIFNKFFRSENASSQDVSGTGLGLYIAKNIIEKSGGKIWFHSEEGKGTKFYFTLPLA